ncbi:Cilia- and flagella-associated protein 58 [Bagarius yarrelli]|uniref:Cilia-and flagella-associated protein 58 n=1 Tax=Bagarius yarrelli TaxID=175774 RepID=A0A556TKQ0_BAGYA|nr:Cilia- and flagella-associated protein 58 [Bagarius yarrelli]
MEKELQEVLNELVGEESLEKFRVEYEKLIIALKKSHENEKRLMTKCRELKAEISSNSLKVEMALKLSHEDQTTILSLKKELEKAWEMQDASNEREKTYKETIKHLQHDVEHLNDLVEQSALLAASEGKSVGDLLKLKDELTAERDTLLSEVVTLRENIEITTTKQYEAEEANMKAQEKILQLQQDIQVCQNECSRETRQKEKLEKEVKQLRANIEAQHLEIKSLHAQCHRSHEEHLKMEQHLHEQKVVNERASKELELLHLRNIKLQHENEHNAISIEHLTNENHQRASELKMEKEEVSQMKHEIAKLTKIRENTQKKLRMIEGQKLEQMMDEALSNFLAQSGLSIMMLVVILIRVAASDERDRLCQLNQQQDWLGGEIETAQKHLECDKRKIDELIREKEMLTKNLIKAANATERQLDLVKLHEQTKKTLDQEILNYKDEAQKQRKIIFHLEKERDRYINEASDLTQKVLLSMEDLKVQEMEIFEYKKKIAEADTKLKQQQNLYEAVRAERNNYSKSLLDTQQEIMEMKCKMKAMSQETGQLTEEIRSKDAALVKEHQEFQRVEKEKEALKAELQKMKQQAQDAKQYMENQDREEQKLIKMISETDTEKARLKKELEQASDPSTFELIQKIHSLQRRLITKSEEVVEKELLLQAVTSELNMYETQTQEYKYEIERLAEELRNVKKKYYMQKRKEQTCREKERSLVQAEQPLIMPQRIDGPRFTGGGFSMKQGNKIAV